MSIKTKSIEKLAFNVQETVAKDNVTSFGEVIGFGITG